MEYTRGEWNKLGWLIVGKNEVLIADCRPKNPVSFFDSYTTSRNTPNGEITANANLIAAAPDLYEALKDMLNIFDRALPPNSMLHSIGRVTCDLAIKALSKAEGLQAEGKDV